MDEKLSATELSKRLDEAASLVTVGAEYTHYKNKRYLVTGLAITEATNEVCVIYQMLYGAGLTFTRPVSNWLETVQVDGQTVPRFAKS